MLGYSILKPLFDQVLATKFVRGVYHSVVLKPLVEGGMKPMAPVDSRYIGVGIDDSKGFSCYCRQTGSAEVIKTDKLGACNNNLYTFQIPHKLVFFHDGEKRSHEDILAQLMKAVFSVPYVKIQKVINIADEILRSEAPTGRFTFKEHTFYASIDFVIHLKLQADTCEVEIQCEKIPNPYC